MKIRPRLILTAFIVNFGLISTQLYNRMTDQVQNRFDSIAKSGDEKNNEMYREILMRGVGEEQHKFDVMNKELWIARNTKENRERNFIVGIERKRNVRDVTTEATRLVDDVAGIQKEFRARHPCDYNTDIAWDEIRNLTRDSHKKICDQLLPHVATPIERDRVNQFRYVEIPADVDIKSVRYIDRAILPIDDCIPLPRIPVLECHYKEKKFYVTHADDKHVFNLERVPQTEIFNLAGLIIPINYDDK